MGTYAYLAQLFVVFLITDLCRYKALVITLGVSGIVTWAMLLWTKSLLELQVLEVSTFKKILHFHSVLRFACDIIMHITTYLLKTKASLERSFQLGI